MDIVQIVGLILVALAMILFFGCGTALMWKSISSKRANERAKNAADRASHDKVFDDESWRMYEHEHALRIQAETREGIKAEQLRKERAKNARLELILKKAKVQYVAE